MLELELQMPLQSKNNRNNSRRHRMVDDVMCLVPVPFVPFDLATQQPQEVIKCFYIRLCSILFSRFKLKFGGTQHETEPVPDGESSQRGLADTFSDCLCCSYIFEPARMQRDRSDPAFAASLFTRTFVLLCSQCSTSHC